MFNFFGLCSGCTTYKIKPGQVGVQSYPSHIQSKREIIPSLQSVSVEQNKGPISLKEIVVSDETLKPVSSFKLDPSKLTQTTGDQYTFVRTVQKSNYEQLHAKLQAKKQKFTDLDFPPENKSLGEDPRMHKGVAKWVRLSEIYKNPVFFADDVSPNDIIQGYIVGAGNCYFMSALANLARTPSRIKQIFGSTELSPQGIYYAKLFYKGVFKEIVVDDFIPVSSALTPVFARPTSNSYEIWVQILQKCYAKLCGNYQNMAGGLPSEAYYALTGSPTFFYSLVDSKGLTQTYWKVLFEAHQKNYCIDIGTPQTVDPMTSLKQNHAYTVLGVYQIEELKILKIRNPMGKMQWIGRASDYDIIFWNSVSPQTKELLGYQPNKLNDGIFFMLYEDLATYYALFEVCEYKDNANVLSLRQKFTMKNANMFEIQTRGGEVVVSLVEDSQRGTGVELKTIRYSKSYIIIAKLLKNSKGQKYYKIVKLASKNQFAAHHQRLNLEPGVYIAYCKYQWIDNVDKNASFIVYSNNPIQIKQVKQSQHPQFLQNTFLSIPRQSPDFNDPQQDYVYVKKFYGQSGGYGFYAVKVKKDIKKSVIIQIDEQTLKQSHLILKKPYKNKGKSKITLKQGEEIIIIFRSKDIIIPKNLFVPQLLISLKQ